MKVLITAGGTTEPIDSVRSITNTSTGKLGSLIGEKYGEITDITKIYYVCGKNSMIPESEKVEVIFVDTVANLEITVRNIVKRDSIDIIIHSMAVSDYRVKAVTSSAMLSSALNYKLDSLGTDHQQVTGEFIMSLFQEAETILCNDSKIRSDMKDLILNMEQTPKIISIFKTIAPQAILVGFKLLDNVILDELINTAFQVLQKNRCSFVLANDLREISMERHVGYLIDENKNYTKCTTKEEIADLIVLSTMKRRWKSI